jgi:hypothetical protein
LQIDWFHNALSIKNEVSAFYVEVLANLSKVTRLCSIKNRPNSREILLEVNTLVFMQMWSL